MAGESDLNFGATVRGLAPGQQFFGRFTLVRTLGRGGMGVVWLAHDEKLDLDVAVKFLPEAVGGDEAAVADLARETRRARELAHPHIVRVYDFHQDERLAGISMEWVDGGTLTARRLQQPEQIFEPTQLGDWVDQMSEALDYAHRRAKVVHRDLKPANLMVGADGYIKVTDFGISASVSESVTRVSRLASSSGSPPYMSPQQMLGGRPSPADDIYALGATLYELLTGKPPFHAGAIAVQVQSVVPPSLAERRREFEKPAGNIPAAWEDTIAACLAKRPEDRPRSAGDVAVRLRRTDRVVVAADAHGDAPTVILPVREKLAEPSPPSAEAVPDQPPSPARVRRRRGPRRSARSEPAERIEVPERSEAKGPASADIPVKPVSAPAPVAAKPAAQPAVSRPFYKRQFVKLCFTLSVLAALVIGAFAFWQRTPALQEQPPFDNSGIATEPAMVEPTDDELPPAPMTGTISFRILGADLGIEGLQSTVDDNVVTPNGHNDVWRLERVAVGTHTVALLHADYEPWSQQITVQDQEHTLVDVTLEPKPMTLTLEVFGPSQYELFVDGELADSSDNWVSLPPGLELALEVRAAGFMPATRTLATKPNGADTWSVVLEKIAGPEMGQPWTVPELELEMVFVSPGQFLMGSPADEPGHQSDEEPQTWVTLTQGYWLGKYEVTQGEWAALMNSNPSYATSMGEQAPVEQVTWDEAMAFCQMLTEREQSAGRLPASLAYTLPTEAQWEYACRAGTTEAYAGNLDALAWYADNSGGATHEVGEKLSNEWGFYDMHGNVWEWCADWYAEELPGGFVDDPTGRNPGANRINRGGGCSEAVERCRSAYRSVNPPDFRHNALGFRLALSSVP